MRGKNFALFLEARRAVARIGSTNHMLDDFEHLGLEVLEIRDSCRVAEYISNTNYDWSVYSVLLGNE